jgi:hypothetical protein
MNEDNKVQGLRLEIEELEKGRKPGGCYTSSSTSPLCTCACKDTIMCVLGE